MKCLIGEAVNLASGLLFVKTLDLLLAHKVLVGFWQWHYQFVMLVTQLENWIFFLLG